MSVNAVECRKLRKSFGRERVLEDMDLEVGKGKIVGLLGPSGSGKTTLLRCIAGLAKIDSGEVVVNGAGPGDRRLSKVLGYMAQSDALYPDLSGRQNLEYFASFYGLRGAAFRERAASVMKLVGLDGHGDKVVVHYSGGMRKRLSLAIALIHEPELLILDEPTVGIDPLLRAVFWDEFRALAGAGRTLLVSTHVMDEAERCDELALLYGGRVLAAGTPSAIRERFGAASIEEAFISLRESGRSSGEAME